MSLRILFLSVCLSLLALVHARAADSSPLVSVVPSGYVEAAVSASSEGWEAPDPYLLCGVDFVFRHGWSAYFEVDYDHRIAPTQFYLRKAFSSAFAVSMGKITVPVGMANVYDVPTDHFGVSLPVAEEVVLPFDTDLPAVSFLASAGSWHAEALALLAGDSLALAARVSREFSFPLEVSIAAFWNRRPVVSADLSYVSPSFVARAVATRSWITRALHVGAEAGFNLLSLASRPLSSSLFCFARYDLLRQASSPVSHLLAFGFDYCPVSPLVIKAQCEFPLRPSSLPSSSPFPAVPVVSLGVALVIPDL